MICLFVLFCICEKLYRENRENKLELHRKNKIKQEKRKEKDAN
jgi:hypothetical protein